MLHTEERDGSVSRTVTWKTNKMLAQTDVYNFVHINYCMSK